MMVVALDEYYKEVYRRKLGLKRPGILTKKRVALFVLLVLFVGAIYVSGAPEVMYKGYIKIADVQAPKIVPNYPNFGDVVNATYLNMTFYVYDEDTDVDTVRCMLNIEDDLRIPERYGDLYVYHVNLTGINGVLSLIIYANDSAGNLAYSAITFYSDAEAPEIELVSPENESRVMGVVDIVFNITDMSPVDVWYDVNESNVNISLVYPYIIHFNTTELVNGCYIFDVYANDTFGRLSSYRAVFYVDHMIPSVSVYNYTGVVYVNQTILLEVENVEELIYSWDGGLNQTLSRPYVVRAPNETGVHVLSVWARNPEDMWFYFEFIFNVTLPPGEETGSSGGIDTSVITVPVSSVMDSLAPQDRFVLGSILIVIIVVTLSVGVWYAIVSRKRKGGRKK